MAIKLDMTKFKKIKEDKEITTLKHDDGHMIHVAHNALPHKTRKELKSLPMVNLAAGGDVKAPSSDDEIIAKKQAVDDYNQSHDKDPKPYPDDVLQTLAATDITPQSPMNMSTEQSPMSSQEGIPAAQQEGLTVEPIQTAPQMSSNEPSSPGLAAVAPSQAPPQAGPPQPGVAGEPSLLSGYQQQLHGLGQEAAVQGQLGQQEAVVLQHRIADQEQAAKAFQTNWDKNEAERNAIAQDLKNSHISPDHYWDNHSKVATGLGLILAGFNPSNHPNAALEFLNKNIDRDTQAQIADIGKKENLLGHAMQQFNNIKDASAFVNMIKADEMANQLHMAAAQAQDPMAKAKFNTLAGQLQQQFYPNYLNMTMRQALIQHAGNGGNAESLLPYMRVMNPEMAKDMESRLVPGVGMAQIPIPAEDRRTIVAKQQLHERIKDMYEWSKQHSGSLSPSDINIGKTKAAELQSLYRNAINGGVFKKGEQEFIDTIVDSDPTKFFNSIRVLPKLKEVMTSNWKQLNTLKQSFGLPVQQGPQLSAQEQSFLSWAKAHPNDPRSAAVIKKLSE